MAGFPSTELCCRTDELEGLLEVLPQVLLVAVGGGKALVLEQAELVVVERQVRGDVQDEADVHALHELQVLSVPLVAQVQRGEDGWSDSAFLDVRRGGQGIRYAGAAVLSFLQVKRVLAQIIVALSESTRPPTKHSFKTHHK